MTEDLRTQFKEIKERERNAGLFMLAILFSLIVGIGSNAIYDLIIRPSIIYQAFIALVTLGLIIAVIREIRYSDKRMTEMEQKIKELEKGGEKNETKSTI